MNELEAFEEFITNYAKEHTHFKTPNRFEIWKASAGRKDKRIAELEAELKALRCFVLSALTSHGISWEFENMLIGLAKGLNLIDENGNPTKHLTGEN